ncbi:MAG: hypothetical protein NC253_11335 [Ruminococcus sp.]|nr:hypothetical protein [Ruminococcus sp.]MCM1382145.1 hypothetical protein [Muribaculaceae bacterium]MCM1480828.1 hypothetical protein [Muribaculaceae bacterium]
MNAREIIKAELTESGRTQIWLVKKVNEAGININKQRMSGIMRGERVLTADEFLVMCKILNITVNERR